MPVLSGKTRDANGNALGGATVKVFKTDDTLVASGSSNASGDYSFIVADYGPYYVTAFKDGSPFVSGITRRDLMAVDDVTRSTDSTAITNLWTGATDTGSVVVAAELAASSTDVRIAVSTAADLSNPVYSASATTTPYGGLNVVKMSLSGLQPNTQYYYGVRIGNTLYTAKTGKFKTLPNPGQIPSFSIAFGSCAKNFSVPNDIWSVIQARDPLVFFAMGDTPYSDSAVPSGQSLNATYRAQELAKLLATGAGDVYRNIPTRYIWSDHDYWANNITGGALDSTQKAVPSLFYRTRVPHGALVQAASGGVYHSFVVNVGTLKVRFIILDLKSDAAAIGTTDTSTKSILGTAQKNWFKSEIDAAAANNQYVVLVSDVPYSAKGVAEGLASTSGGDTGGDGTDKWWSYSYERRELADYMKSKGMANKVCMLSGDAHMLGYTDGVTAVLPDGSDSRADYATGGGMPIKNFVAAPLDNSTSNKGTGYIKPSVAQTTKQAGMLTFTDNGNGTLGIVFKGFTSGGTDILTHSFTSASLSSVDTTAPVWNFDKTRTAVEGAAFTLDLGADDTVTWTKNTGLDASHFTLSGNSLTLGAKSYATPDDSNGDRVYQVSLTSTNTAGLSTTDIVQVTITPATAATDPSWANVVFLAGFEGANGATSYAEEKNGRAATFTGAAQISTSSPLTGNSSALFSGATNTFITFADNADWRLVPTAGAPFTLELELVFTAVPTTDQYIISQYDTTTGGLGRSWGLVINPITPNDRVAFQWSTDGTTAPTPITLMAASTIVPGQKYRVCIESDGTNLRAYVDGVMTAKNTSFGSVAMFDSSAPLAIGARSTTNSHFFKGKVDEVRITKGVARYASDAGYTVASGPFPRS